MRRIVVVVAVSCAVLAGCAVPPPTAPIKPSASANDPKINLDACLSPMPDRCRFRRLPLKVAPDWITIGGQEYPYRRMVRDLAFVDSQGQDWVAPAGTLTDGASIPGVLTAVVGDPQRRSYVAAAAVHDAYCGKVNADGPAYHARLWPEVHRMFYEGLLAAGTPPARAQLMYAAVWLGGPRWTLPVTHARMAQRIAAADPGDFIVTAPAEAPAPQDVPPLLDGAALQAALAQVQAEIGQSPPSIGALDQFLETLPLVQAEQQGRQGDGVAGP